MILLTIDYGSEFELNEDTNVSIKILKELKKEISKEIQSIIIKKISDAKLYSEHSNSIDLLDKPF